MYPLKFPLKYQINTFNAFLNGAIVRKQFNSAAKNSKILTGNTMYTFDKY